MAHAQAHNRGSSKGRLKNASFPYVMDEVARLIQTFKARRQASALSKLDLLLDLERMSDPRIVPFLADVLLDVGERVEVRTRAIRQLRLTCRTGRERIFGARALEQVLDEPLSWEVRLPAVVALADFTDVDGIPTCLGRVALNSSDAPDTRYSALMALERVGSKPEVTTLVQQLLGDELLGQLAQSLLNRWQRG